MLCARRTSLWLRLVVLTLVVLLVIASWVAGGESWRMLIPPSNPAQPNGSAVLTSAVPGAPAEHCSAVSCTGVDPVSRR